MPCVCVGVFERGSVNTVCVCVCVGVCARRVCVLCVGGVHTVRACRSVCTPCVCVGVFERRVCVGGVCVCLGWGVYACGVCVHRGVCARRVCVWGRCAACV